MEPDIERTPTYDVLTYREVTSPDLYHVGQHVPAFGEGLYVVAVGEPLHDGKAQTIVLAMNPRPMPALQALLDARASEEP